MHDEELGTCGVRVHRAGHRENALGMCQIILETVVGELSLDAVSRAAHSVAVRASALDHEAFDHTVEDQSVIESLIYKT